MELEQEVATALELLGYTIFYRNLNIIYNRSELSEFDIVCSKFIVEVKSGLPHKMNGFRSMVSHRILPKEFKYFIYCKSLPDDMLKHLTEEYDKPNIQFINTLQPIVEQFPPEPKTCWIESQSLFDRFLNLPMETITQFKTIYLSKETFLITYDSLLRYRDAYSISQEGVWWSDKARQLFLTNILQFSESCPNGVLSLKSGLNSIRNQKIKLRKLEMFHIPIVHNISALKRHYDIKQVYISSTPPNKVTTSC